MELNKVTINDAFPMPTIESILARLKGATIFAKLDMEAGYWQIRMKETDKWKTAFATRKGLFEWNFMGFGLKNASACFQREMTHALVDIEGVFPYIDDLMVYAENEDQLIDRIRVVMERLIEINIRPNWAKCEFGMNQIMYCGHLVSPSGIRADVGRFDPIENLANPSTPKEFKSMIGFFNFFRKFIPKFAKWDDDCQKSKEKIVELIKRDITLAYPDRNKSFVIRCDASDVAASFILLQNHEGIERPIYFGSKGFSKEQIGRYAAGQKELFSIVLALRIFRPWILGRKVIIYSDCKSWSWLSSITKPSGLLLRWIYDLLEYDLLVIHIKGKNNSMADVLSRYVIFGINAVHLDSNKKTDIIRQCHESSGAHLGVKRTYEKVRKDHFWKGMYVQIKKHVEDCSTCAVFRYDNKKISTDHKISTMDPFEKIGMDLIGPLAKDGGKVRYLLLMVDYFSKWVELIPMESVSTSDIIEKIIGFSKKWTKPKCIITDAGTAFNSKEFDSYCKRTQIILRSSAVRNQKANGQAESIYKHLKKNISILRAENWKDSWTNIALKVSKGWNEAPSTVTKHSPKDVLEGWNREDNINSEKV